MSPGEPWRTKLDCDIVYVVNTAEATQYENVDKVTTLISVHPFC